MTSYTLMTALSGLWREKWINLLSALTIAAGLFIITLTLVFFYNVDLATKRLPDGFTVTAFLEEGLTASDLDDVMKSLKKNPQVKDARYISKEDALKELKTVIKDSAYLLEGLETNPLPASFELKLGKDAVTGAAVESLAKDIGKIKGVSEVQYGRKFLSVLQSIKTNSQAIGVLFISMLSAGIIFVCYSTVKILFYRKKDEMETLKFLGATRGFIRAPFIIEGGVIGLAGGIISTAGTFSLYYLVYHRLTAFVPIASALSIPDELLLSGPLAGLLIGMAGALIATGRIRF